ncbi:hypothetical protein R1flu_028915 [Riccia fluitans]|uniref:Uncharacterized protein n=1 Tax=Riccia fluitans TaxID=41844 RepID=A0ABD1XN13_9MARC
MRYIGWLMNGESSDWAQTMRFFIKEQMFKQTKCREIKQWSAEEGLLLLPPMSTPHSETTSNILQGWYRCRRFLKLDDNALVLPGSLTLKKILELMEQYRSRRPFNDRVVLPLLKRIGVSVLTNLADSAGNWSEVANALRNHGVQLNQTQAEALDVFQVWLHTVQMGTNKLESSPSWR